MKSLLWTLLTALVLGVVMVALAPMLRASQRQCQGPQSPEAQALLGQELARAHARLGH